MLKGSPPFVYIQQTPLRLGSVSYPNTQWKPLRKQSSSSSVICQTTGPKPLAKRSLHIERSRASSFNSQYPFLSLRSSSNFLRLLPCLLATSIYPFIFPSITCFRRQFLRKKTICAINKFIFYS